MRVLLLKIKEEPVFFNPIFAKTKNLPKLESLAGLDYLLK